MAEISNDDSSISDPPNYIISSSSLVVPVTDDKNIPIRVESRTKRAKATKIEDQIFSLPFLQKLIAEGIGTYFLMFAGCAAIQVNLSTNNVVTLPGIALVWGLVVMIMIYSVGYISGAHFNPAVTIAFATCSCQKFPWKQVPGYIFAQILASILAMGTIRLIFDGKENNHFVGTLPAGSSIQSLVLEFIATFYLMFVICSVATDHRAVGELAGLAIGSTIIVDILFAGPITGASMNPARSIGPAIVFNRYDGLWIYLIGPISGAIAGAWSYRIIKCDSLLKKCIPKRSI